MYSSDTIFKNMIFIDYEFYIFCISSIGLDINKTIIQIIEQNRSKYQFRPQD